MKKLVLGLVMLLMAGGVTAGDGDLLRVYPAVGGATTAISDISQDPFYIVMDVDSAADSTEGTFYTDPVSMGDYGALKLTLNCYRIQERDSGNVFDQVVGTGDFDLGSGGAYTGTQDTVIWIKIAAEGTPDVFVFSIGDTAAGTDSFSTVPDTIEITKAVAQSLGLGKTVTFAEDDNHTADDVFKLNCYYGGYSGYTWKDSIPGSTAIAITAQTYDLIDSVRAIAALDTLIDTGVVEMWLGKGNSFVGQDSLCHFVRFAIRIRDSLGEAGADTADAQYRYWFDAVVQKKK